MTQALALGTLLLVGACLVWPVQSLPLRALSTPAADMALWIIEVLLYLGLAVFFSRSMKGAVAGLALGITTRLATSVLIFLLASIPYSELFVFGGDRGLLHALAVGVSLLALILSFRPLLVNLGLPRNSIAVDPGIKTRVAFDNRPKPATTRSGAKLQVPLVLPSVDDGETDTGEPATHLHPPADFNPILAREDITGTITLPASLILESVPEAKTILAPGYGLSIRLAYIVPQLPRGTVWLTWRQVFEKGVPPMPNKDTAKLEEEFINRWIRLFPRNYVLQVPSSYFNSTKTPPAWMKLPEIENESEITFHAT